MGYIRKQPGNAPQPFLRENRDKNIRYHCLILPLFSLTNCLGVGRAQKIRRRDSVMILFPPYVPGVQDLSGVPGVRGARKPIKHLRWLANTQPYKDGGGSAIQKEYYNLYVAALVARLSIAYGNQILPRVQKDPNIRSTR